MLFNGVDVTNARRGDLQRYRTRIGMIFQDPYETLNPKQTIFDFVAEPLVVNGFAREPDERRQRVFDALESAGLRPAQSFAWRYPHELSGGQRQRVVIAGALVLGPKLVVADEPVSMLDVSIRTELLRLMLDLRAERDLTYLFITHDLSLAWVIADRVAVMYLGRIMEIGPANTVISTPRHPYTAALVSVAPVARAAGAGRAREADDPRRRDAGRLGDPERLPVPDALSAGVREVRRGAAAHRDRRRPRRGVLARRDDAPGAARGTPSPSTLHAATRRADLRARRTRRAAAREPLPQESVGARRSSGGEDRLPAPVVGGVEARRPVAARVAAAEAPEVEPRRVVGRAGRIEPAAARGAGDDAPAGRRERRARRAAARSCRATSGRLPARARLIRVFVRNRRRARAASSLPLGLRLGCDVVAGGQVKSCVR